jgi:hypothetical protein
LADELAAAWAGGKVVYSAEMSAVWKAVNSAGATVVE